MKKYTIRVGVDSSFGYCEFNLLINAQNERSAINKAKKQAVYIMGDKNIPTIEKVTYEGFYLNRRFFSVNSL